MNTDRIIVNYLEEHRGRDAALKYAKQTLQVYRNAVLDHHHFAATAHYKRAFIMSYLFYKHYLAETSKQSGSTHSPQQRLIKRPARIIRQSSDIEFERRVDEGREVDVGPDLPYLGGGQRLRRGHALVELGHGRGQPLLELLVPLGQLVYLAYPLVDELYDPELDRVLGGGLVPASLVLLGGEPGVGKSTLLLTALAAVSRERRGPVGGGEEAVGPVERRAQGPGGPRRGEPVRGDGGAASCERRGAPMRIALVRSRAEEPAGAVRGGAPACSRPPWHRQNKKPLRSNKKKTNCGGGQGPKAASPRG